MRKIPYGKLLLLLFAIALLATQAHAVSICSGAPGCTGIINYFTCIAMGCTWNGPMPGPICESTPCADAITDCCADAPFCVGPAGDRACASCIPDGDAATCGSGAECCSGACNLAGLCETIFLPALADYVASIDAPSSATVGVPFSITVNTTNIGTDDGFDFSTTTVEFTGSSAQAITVDGLRAGGMQSDGLTFTCASAGTRMFTVTADSDANIAESNEGNNAVTRPVDCLAAAPPPQPDYISHALASATVSLGATFAVDYDVQNAGGAAGENASVVRITFTGNPAQNIVVPALAAGQMQMGSASFICSNPGSNIATVIADQNSNVSESDETNNQAAFTITCGTVVADCGDLPCADDWDCCPLAPNCAQASASTPLRCMECIPDGSPTQCDAAHLCCSGAVCGGDSLCHANQPPGALPIPSITSSTPTFNVGSSAQCGNCPPVPTPIDPETGAPAATIDYLWYLDGAPLGAWSSVYSDYTCAGACAEGSSVALHVRACDASAPPVCAEAVSAPLVVAAPPPPPPTTPFCRSDQFNGILQLCAIAGIGMAALIAFFYMIGEMMQNARMLSWAKTEAMQVFISLVIAMVILWVLSIFCQIEIGEMTELLGLPGLPAVYATRSDANFYNAGMLYLENLGGAGLANIASLRYNLGAYEIRTSFNNYECDSICLLSLSSTNVAVFGGETSSLALTNNLLSLATISYLSSIFQYFVLLYIMNGLFIVFLPLAMVMRSIPFMRNFGGALIGIFVALYLFYPAMLVFDGFVVPGMTRAIGMPVVLVDRTGSHCGTGDGYNLGLGIFNGSVGCVSGRGEAEFDNTGISGVQQGDMMELLPTISHEDGDGNLIVDGIWPPYDVASSIKINVLIFLASVFFPAMNFIVIAALARDLSRFLGEEADISRLGQMV